MENKILYGTNRPDDLLWVADTRRYTSLKKSSHELNLMLTQCQRILGKDEKELFELLNNIKTSNVDYMGFVSEYLLKQSNYSLINQVVAPAQKEKGLTTYLRSLDREGIFGETFEQITTMKNKVLNLGILTEPHMARKGTIPATEYENAYAPLFNSFENMRAYFYPTAEDTPEKE